MRRGAEPVGVSLGLERDLDLCWRVEEACLNAWPATRAVMLGGWLARLSDGPTRRTDSVNPRRGSPPDPTPILQEAAALFAERGRPTLFRLPTMVQEADQILTDAGFSHPEAETCTLYAPALGAGPRDQNVFLNELPDKEWLRARARFNEADETASLAYERMLGLIVGPRRFAAVRLDGQIAAIAYGVISRGLLVIESVATDPTARRTGLGRKTVGALMDWGAEQGAHAACLQVVAANAPAHALYRSVGFSRELYRYHYRRAQTPP